MALDSTGIPFHPSEYDPDYPRVKCVQCGYMNSCTCDNQEYIPWYPRLPILLEGGTLQTIPENNIYFHEWTLWSLDKIRDTEISNHKLLIADFIHPDLLQKLLQEWPSVMTPDPEVAGRNYHEIHGIPAYEDLSKYIFNNWYIQCALVDKFGLEIEYESNANFWLWKDSPPYSVSDVHIDYKDFDMTFGLYLPGNNDIAEYGTEFWDPQIEVDDIWDNDQTDIERSMCKMIDRAPFTDGTCYFMPRTKHSWHSSPFLDKPMERKHVYGYYKTARQS